MTAAAPTILFISGILFVFLFIFFLVSLRRFRIRRPLATTSDVPTVSVCIPARNEMHALAECLERVLASTYPKLEVLVLDDRSQDETSIIIKSFAHAGVRFISGKPLPLGWLGRNYALDTLVREASGTYIVFMDVDTFIKPQTIDELVNYSHAENKAMVSVIPRRYDTYRASVLFGTLRYFWQFTLRSRNRVPVTSSIWLAKRETLLTSLDELSAFGSEIEPEEVLALKFGTDYQCVMSDEELGVGYEKRWRSQLETGRRQLFPLFGKDFSGVIKGLLLFVFLNIPTFFVIAGVIGWTWLNTLAAVLVVFYGCLYAFYTKQIWVKRWWLGVVVWPYVALQELVLFVASVWGYVRKTITWKNRSIHTDTKPTNA